MHCDCRRVHFAVRGKWQCGYLHTHPLSFFAAILKMAGLLVVSMCALAIAAPLLPTLPITHISFTFHPLQLLIELQSQEQGCHHLQQYSSLLLTRVANREPSILDQLMGRGQG